MSLFFRTLLALVFFGVAAHANTADPDQNLDQKMEAGIDQYLRHENWVATPTNLPDALQTAANRSGDEAAIKGLEIIARRLKVHTAANLSTNRLVDLAHAYLRRCAELSHSKLEKRTRFFNYALPTSRYATWSLGVLLGAFLLESRSDFIVTELAATFVAGVVAPYTVWGLYDALVHNRDWYRKAHKEKEYQRYSQILLSFVDNEQNCDRELGGEDEAVSGWSSDFAQRSR